MWIVLRGGIWHPFLEIWAKVKFFSEIKPPLAGPVDVGGGEGHAPQILADQLTLFQPGKAG